MAKKTLGGQRLGTENSKMEVEFDGFPRTNKDLSFINTFSAGIGQLLPAYVEKYLPGDEFEIDTTMLIDSEPTIKQMYGTFKAQLDFFFIPDRLYLRTLHNNPIGTSVGSHMTGLEMQNVPYPKVLIKVPYYPTTGAPAGKYVDNLSLAAYMGIKSTGHVNTVPTGISPTPTAGQPAAYRKFNAIPFLGYADIYKNYYANLQETIGVQISGFSDDIPTYRTFDLDNIDEMRMVLMKALGTGDALRNQEEFKFAPALMLNGHTTWSDTTVIQNDVIGRMLECHSALKLSGVFIKTYLNDRNNVWLNTAANNSIISGTRVATPNVGGGYAWDAPTFLLETKTYNFLNRIFAGGGDYRAWIEEGFGVRYESKCEIPMYIGGENAEIMFNTVVSTAAGADPLTPAETNPLGTLGGRGAAKTGGRKIHFKTDEPGFIMGIFSITPRVRYSDFNADWVNVENYDQLHKPSMDGLGYQDLNGENLDGLSTTVSGATTANNYIITTKTMQGIGKQPAWTEYTTRVDESNGTLAAAGTNYFMCLNRTYGLTDDEQINTAIPLTYIDASQFNKIFANTTLAAQNFYIQIGFDVTAKRIMNDKLIPFI